MTWWEMTLPAAAALAGAAVGVFLIAVATITVGRAAARAVTARRRGQEGRASIRWLMGLAFLAIAVVRLLYGNGLLK